MREDVKSFEVLNLGEDERGLEQVWCGKSKSTDKVLVGCMFRPPASDPRILKELLKFMQRAKDRVALGEFKTFCGGFHLPNALVRYRLLG